MTRHLSYKSVISRDLISAMSAHITTRISHNSSPQPYLPFSDLPVYPHTLAPTHQPRFLSSKHTRVIHAHAIRARGPHSRPPPPNTPDPRRTIRPLARRRPPARAAPRPGKPHHRCGGRRPPLLSPRPTPSRPPSRRLCCRERRCGMEEEPRLPPLLPLLPLPTPLPPGAAPAARVLS